MLCHTGSQPGWKAHLAYIPDRDLGMVILSNRDDTRPAALAASIMAELIADEFPAPHPADDGGRRSEEAALTAGQITALEGSYVDPDTGEWAAFTVEDRILRGETLGDPVFLYSEGGGVFRDAGFWGAVNHLINGLLGVFYPE